jgi:hypothetical protein
MLEDLDDRRKDRRILAVSKMLDLEKQFLGFTLDLTADGICMIVSNKFEDSREFEIIIQQNRKDGDKPEIRAKIEKIWRKQKDKEFDEIGGKIIAVDSRENLEELIKYCAVDASIKYDFDMSIFR